MEYTKEGLIEAKSQITLAKRRVRAFEIANYFIEKEIENRKT